MTTATATGVRIIEPTQLQDLEACPRLHAFRQQGLVRRRPNPKLYTGSGWHAFMAGFYREGSSHKAGLVALARYAREEWQRINQLVAVTPEQQAEFHNAVRLLVSLSRAYAEWSREQDPNYFVRVVAVEQPFEVPIPSTNYVLAGRIDLLVEDRWGQIWPVDHKSTTGGWPDADLLRLNTQFECYWFSAKALFPDRRVPGVIYNGVRLTNPKTARKEVFYRKGIRYPEAAVESIYRKLLALVEMYEAMQGADYIRPQPGMHCGWKCAYTELCIATENQTDLSALIEELYVIDNGTPNYLRGDD